MRFPPSFIENLRANATMSAIIGRRMPLKKHGREFQGLCPFHNEKTPSFTVNDAKGFFHCFGCGAHGDAIEFIRKYDHLTYPEAVETLSRELGIAIPQPDKDMVRRIEREKTLTDALEAATLWFEKQLMSTSGAIALEYVTRRGLKPDTVRQFRVGFAPDERQALHKHLLVEGFSKQLQLEAGLIIVPDNGQEAYDRFRGRVMFPIRNSSGKVVAFGGRLLEGNSNKNLPKYLNSSETELFKKGEMLYNLDLAKRPAREGNMVVVLEGYMDVVSVAQNGVSYAVATLGTAVTPEHLKLLWQLAKEPILCLDGDAAGKRAMQRCAEVALPLLKPGYSLRFATLPAGEDPDSYIQKHGKASFEKILHASPRLSQTLWDMTVPGYKLTHAEGRIALEDACKKLAEKIADPSVKSHYLDYFRKQLWASARPPLTKQKSGNGKPPLTVMPRSPLVEQMVVAHHSAALETLTQRLLKILLKFPTLLHKSHVEETLAHLDIRNHRLDALRNTLLSAHGHTDIDSKEAVASYVHAQLPDSSLDALIQGPLGLGLSETMSLAEATALWNDTVAAYEITHLEVELKETQERMGQSMDDTQLQRMVELQNALRKAQTARTFAPADSDNF